MKLTEREKIAHLYRRFSFGGTCDEIEAGVKAGLDKTIQKLVNYNQIPQTNTVHPYEFAWKEKEEAEVGIWKFRMWWVLKMLTTPRPLQEKLSLFWHSHFAVSDAKVENACLTLEYIQAIRDNANGKFVDLAKSMAKSPAMMRYLDMERAVKGRPNENFAREVFELFTMGIGSYTEKDVQEASRALTGWGMIDTYWTGGNDNTERLQTLYRDNRPAGAFCYMPAMRDTTPKTILGVTKDFDGDSLIELLCKRTETANFISKKLWEFFAYPDPEPPVLKRISGVFQKSGGDIKQVMLAIAKSTEFYSEKCVNMHFKSPADYVLGPIRQMNLGAELMAIRGNATPTTPMAQPVVDNLGTVLYHMGRQGLDLCYPQDVSGWRWGKEWITPSMMTVRMQYHGIMIWDNKGPTHATFRSMDLVAKTNPKTPEEIAARFKEVFDLRLSDNADKILIKIFVDRGADTIKNKDHWAGTLYTCFRVLSACPDFHIC